MTNFIPIFPLAIVVYPGEMLNLHIFEPRYKQMITECSEGSKPFGIPTVLNNQVSDIGTLMEIAEVTKVYDNGEMDIKTRGVQVFHTLEMIKNIPDKLYNGAIVNYPNNNLNDGKPALMKKVINAIRELHQLLNVTKDFKKEEGELTTYDVAHHAGLTLEGEYELLGLLHEAQRQEYLKRHLSKVLPVLAQMEVLKDRIKQNGHFKNLSSFDL